MAVFWLSASAAWANGVINMKYAADPDSWLFKDASSMCEQTTQDTYVNTEVKSCTVDFTGNFNKANISIVSSAH
jgi:hypothetical protein